MRRKKVAIRRWDRQTLREIEYNSGNVLQRWRCSGSNDRLFHLGLLASFL